MTRLRNEDIDSITDELLEFDRKLKTIIGCSLKKLALRAAGFKKPGEAEDIIRATLVGVVPVSAGQGMIKNFSDTIAGIASHIGFKAFVTRASDTAGFAEAVESNCDILIMADDDVFIAYNCRTGTLSNNNQATANGFVTGSEMMIGGFDGKETLVLGAGPIGKFSIKRLLEKGSRVAVYDNDLQKVENIKKEFEGDFPDKLKIERDMKRALNGHIYICDATPASDIIDESDVSEETFITAPGIPCGLTERAVKKIGNRFLHDNLRIGTATMLIRALGGKERK